MSLTQTECQRVLPDEDPLQELQLSGGVARPVLLHVVEQAVLQHKAVATAITDLREESKSVRTDSSGRGSHTPGG